MVRVIFAEEALVIGGVAAEDITVMAFVLAMAMAMVAIQDGENS